ncbi:MAG: hypothetical protein HY510_06825 [Acidobacteria bacterium]|nr:hypothetical protein [Acidobacteriota bacterium]
MVDRSHQMMMRSRHARTGAAVLAALALLQEAPAGMVAAEEEIAGENIVSKEEVAALRREIRALRDQIRALQARVEALAPAAAPQAPPAAPGAAPEVPGASPTAPTPAVPRPAQSPNLLNPAISGVFQLVGNSSLRSRRESDGFSLSEGEIVLEAAADPYAKVNIVVTIPAGESPDFEEAYVTTLSLPHSLQLKGGRFRSALGRWNPLHEHAFFTVDLPNVLRNFLGENLRGDGFSLSALVPNPADLFIESVTEVASTGNEVAFNSRRSDPLFLERLRVFIPASPDASLEAGITGIYGNGGATEKLLQDIEQFGPILEPRRGLASSLQGIDLTYKWKPLTVNTLRSFTWQTEFLRSRRRLEVLRLPALELATARAWGAYTYAEYQFRKRWRIGTRLDYSELPDDPDAIERAGSVVLRFQPSEFQEIRFQYKRTGRNDPAAARFDGRASDDEIFIQWIPTIGVHAAHKF